MNINRQWLLSKRPEGMVTRENFEYAETPIPEAGAGEVLVRNLFLSFDPTQRGWMVDRPSYLPPVAIGAPMRAGSVGQVMASQHSDFEVGDIVQTTGGWQDFVVAAPGQGPMGLTKLPAGVPPEMMLSVLGITGLTAYFGLLDLGMPKAGETVLISGAAGATGSVAGQIAKIKGCRVVGIAGGKAKCDYLINDLGFDAAIDYKNDNIYSGLKAHCPKGIDIFFDNVGGAILDGALTKLRMNARVVICGAISQYNTTTKLKGPSNYLSLLVNRASMKGMVVFDYKQYYPKAIADYMKWTKAGLIKSKEDTYEGIENFNKTFLRLFSGDKIGKLILKVND